jgi:multidrug efflux system outer membrane protein
MKKILIAISLLIFIVGCSVGPDYVRPDLEMPDSTVYKQDYTVEDSLALALADTTWCELFGDTVLTYLITNAVQENNDIKIAAARVDEFMGLYDVNQSDYYPKFDEVHRVELVN